MTVMKQACHTPNTPGYHSSEIHLCSNNFYNGKDKGREVRPSRTLGVVANTKEKVKRPTLDS